MCFLRNIAVRAMDWKGLKIWLDSVWDILIQNMLIGFDYPVTLMVTVLQQFFSVCDFIKCINRILSR